MSRWQVVSAPHGIAALRHTHWLDEAFRAYPDTPGEWAATAGRVVGRRRRPDGVDADVTLAPGDEVVVDGLLLRAFSREGALALRVFDPDAPSRTTLSGILSFPPTDRWRFAGRFVPAGAGERRVIRSVDGHEREEPAIGTVEGKVENVPVRLTVSRGPRGLSAVFADATSGDDSYRFRFLPIDEPDDENEIVVDFSRAYLPPCAFSDQYICPLPPPENRLPIRIEAGERLPRRSNEPALAPT